MRSNGIWSGRQLLTEEWPGNRGSDPHLDLAVSSVSSVSSCSPGKRDAFIAWFKFLGNSMKGQYEKFIPIKLPRSKSALPVRLVGAFAARVGCAGRGATIHLYHQ